MVDLRDFHENIAQISLETFKSLPKTGKPKENEWTVLSCIVQERNSNFESVALGTGSKCIGKNKMSNKGDILNDSHAEIICRRAFLQYLYHQMIKVCNRGDSIFTYNAGKQKFELGDVKFHFFTTLMPCGDATIFLKQCSDNFGSIVVKNENVGKNDSRKRVLKDTEDRDMKKCKTLNDVYRTGAKCLDGGLIKDLYGEGANYHVTGVVRTKPGRGDPTLSVSCSDKIAKWCFLGIQGALLSTLIDNPVYISSFTVIGGTPFNEFSLNRAFLLRFDKINQIEAFRSTGMILGQARSEFSFQKCESKNVLATSIIWFKSDNFKSVEVAVDGRKQGVTKKNIKSKGASLKICKVELFSSFLVLLKILNISFGDDLNNMTYLECKKLATDYQKKWDQLKLLFKVWTFKDPNLLRFCVC